MPTNWTGDWPERIENRVKESGYDSVTAFADERPTLTYKELAGQLGDDVAPIQVINLLYSEAVNENRVNDFAKASLVRYLREYTPDGWGGGDDFDLLRAKAFASWLATMTVDFEDVAERVLGEFKSSALVYEGWLPENSDDPVIEDAFRKALS